MARADVTNEEVFNAIMASGGILTDAAKIVGMTRQSVKHRIDNDSQLQEAMDAAKQVLLDRAEAKLFKAVEAGSAWAVKFVLARLGKDRGYSGKLEVEGNAAIGRIVLTLPDDGREQFGPSNGDSCIAASGSADDGVQEQG